MNTEVNAEEVSYDFISTFQRDLPVTRSSILLAGGLGTRLNGYEKALLPLEEGTFIENTLQVLESVSDEVVVSFRDEEQLDLFREYVCGKETVIDKLRNIGPLGGMLEGFKKASGEYVFVVACDMPYLNGELINLLFERLEGHDAVLPVNSSGQKEPLHAVYRRKPMLSETKRCVGEGLRSVMAPVSALDDVLFLESEEISKIDKDLLSFTNINTARDMDMLGKDKPR
ncbi:molybdenum cofactor guanylyltransferase [Methanolobus zinderi]|uniref:Probable molybdenum cofactor guanylyltransferase n=1 Tax=Methanolobus zinderi TaxID=536044 RepID=A0A7D5I3P8_9EURY|nr:molybdenum cofactor guanylyltransferase [Methanolobus zinderi]QLC49548.1 molybdenum cofactor guanylyltransferase [Methanolobus zinderi]